MCGLSIPTINSRAFSPAILWICTHRNTPHTSTHTQWGWEGEREGGVGKGRGGGGGGRCVCVCMCVWGGVWGGRLVKQRVQKNV